jgi:hypothetical protein
VPTLRPTLASPVVRTHFDDDDAWAALKQAIRTPGPEGFLGSVDVVEDREFADLDASDVIAAVPETADHAVMFIADRTTSADPEFPLVVRSLIDAPGQTFRVAARALWAVENNLSLANLGWEDFVRHLDEDGILRGF